MPLNQLVSKYSFLEELYRDGYYPDEVVDKGKAILLRMCDRIEAERPADLAALYVITHAATEEFNQLQDDFEEAGSHIETVAREAIAMDFDFVPGPTGSPMRTSRSWLLREIGEITVQSSRSIVVLARVAHRRVRADLLLDDRDRAFLNRRALSDAAKLVSISNLERTVSLRSAISIRCCPLGNPVWLGPGACR